MKRPEGIKAWAVLLWLAIWEIAALAASAGEGRLWLFLPSPGTVFLRLCELAGEADFWRTILASLSRIAGGFVAAFILALFLAALSFRFRFVKDFLAPLVLSFRSVPVASFVVLALIFFGNGLLSVLISFLIAFPLLYQNALSGMESASPELLSAADSLSLPESAKLRYIYFPAAFPFLRAAVKTAAGMAWKAGTAAELIGNPSGSIGQRLYQAKIFLETPDLLAWTLAIIVLSLACERLFVLFLDKARKAILKL